MAYQTRSETAIVSSQYLVIEGRNNSGELNICDLIDDVLIAIFNFLDVYTLLAFCETVENYTQSERLHRIIIDKVIPSKVLYLDTDAKILKLLKKYNVRATKISIKIANCNLINTFLRMLPKLCQPVGQPGMLTEFHIHVPEYPVYLSYNSRLILQSLPLLQNVIHLTFDGHGGELYLQAKSLSRIRSLKLDHVNLCGENFHFNVDSFPNLRRLHLHCQCCTCRQKHWKIITNFILMRPQLESLYFSGINSNPVFLKVAKNFENIKSLGVIVIHYNISNDDEKIKQIGEILKNLATKNKIKTLSFRFYNNNFPLRNWKFDASVYSKIYLEIPCLQCLHLIKFECGVELDKLLNFVVMKMRNIKTLKLTSTSKVTHKSLIGIIKSNQLLEVLIIDAEVQMSERFYSSLLKERGIINSQCQTPKSLNIFVTQEINEFCKVNLRKIYNPQIVSLSPIELTGLSNIFRLH